LLVWSNNLHLQLSAKAILKNKPHLEPQFKLELPQALSQKIKVKLPKQFNILKVMSEQLPLSRQLSDI